MNAENKLARLMRNTGPARFFIPVGIILIVVGLILMNMKTDNYDKTSGTITSVVAVPGEENQTQYDVGVSYEVNGKTYETVFSNLNGDYKVGNTIDVYYNPDDPQKASNGKMAGFVPPIIIAVGAIATLYGILRTVQAFRKSKALDAAPGAEVLKEFDFQAYKNAPGVTEYYFRFDGNALKPGYLIEDAGRNVLFEGKMLKNNPVAARTFEFSDHTTGSVQEHEVGHTVSQTYNDGFFTMRSWFKFDGENIWDLLHNRGVRLSTDVISKFPYMVYNAAKDGSAFARIESTSKYVHEDEEAEHKILVPVGHLYYRVWTDSKDLQNIFLTIFAISECDQAIVE